MTIRSIHHTLTAALSLGAVLLSPETATAFAPSQSLVSSRVGTSKTTYSLLSASGSDDDSKQDVLAAAIDAMYGGGSEMREEPAVTRARIQELVDKNPVLLFMKGSKFFPQCGFSDTATKILESYGVEFETVDVLEDEAIREGVKIFSQWPTIPQLYIKGEFIGGSDIMLEMHQDGSLKHLVDGVTEKAE